MAINLWEATAFNNYQTSLLTGIASNATIVYLPSGASGLVAPGVLVLDQFNQSGALTTTLREYISFATVNTTQREIAGLTRGLAGSTAQAHTIGALVEGVITVTHWTDLIDFLQAEHSSLGGHVISTATISYTETKQLNLTSMASIAMLNITEYINGSGASLNGIIDNPLTAKFVFTGSLSGITTALQTPLVMPISGTWGWVNVVTQTVASGASVIFDINKNGTSIFSAGTRPKIVGAGTFVSTASLASLTFNQGDQFNWDFDGPSNVGGFIQNFNIFLHAI